MKKKWKAILGGIAIISMTIAGFYFIPNAQKIKIAARQASVQVVFDIPVLKVSFTKPLAVTSPLVIEDINTLLQKKIEEAIVKERELQNIDKYRSFLTDFTVYGVTPPSPTELPLGIVAPRWAKFPERVLSVYVQEKSDIKVSKQEFEKDIITISEIANISISQAKSVVSKLNMDGYSISKDTITIDKEIKLLWFKNGWDSTPQELNWSVSLEGYEKGVNFIKGYDPRGILQIESIPKDRKLVVSAGYFDLKEEFKPKTNQVEQLEKEIKELQENLDKANKKLVDKDAVVAKRDIRKATLFDVMSGDVKLESFIIPSAASGVFLGNMKVQNTFDGYQYNGQMDAQVVSGEYKGVILTNAHVASMSKDFEFLVSKDFEVMYILFPANSYIRYTQDSDIKGTPAQLLYYDSSPVLSWDYDCAIMVTTAIPQYERYKASLGNSSKVKEGDPVIMVGNPAFMQKFLTSGVVSNTSYNIMKSMWGDRILKEGLSKQSYNWIVNSNFWFDTPIGVGGTSGSGVWAMSGSEKGKVIALHNMGMVSQTSIINNKYAVKLIDDSILSRIYESGALKDVLQSYAKILFSDTNTESVDYVDDDIFTNLIQKHRSIGIAGMNGGIPINRVKQYLQERGLDPSTFGWDELKSKYWTK